MSKHWNPPPTRGQAVRFGRQSQWTRAQDYWRDTAHHRRMPPGAKVALVLIAVACAGIAVGLYQVSGTHAEFTATDPSADWSAVQPALAEERPGTIVPEAKMVAADPVDAQWAARASGGRATGLPRGSGARNASVRVSPSTGSGQAFGSCKWGGGTNCVVDGDTFWIAGQKVRIADIDAPETHDYRCASELALGDRATAQLKALLNSGAVTMTHIDRDRDKYGRLLRNVSVNGQDVGEVLISAGVARAYAGGRRPWC